MIAGVSGYALGAGFEARHVDVELGPNLEARAREALELLEVDEAVFASEQATNQRNRGTAHLLAGYDRMYCDPDEATVRQLAEELSLDEHAVEDALAVKERPKATRFATHLFLTSLFGVLVSPRGALRERRDELCQLASLFLEQPDRPRRRA